MARKAKYLGGVGDRGLGMEFRYYREKAGMSCAQVGAVLGWSANTISRLERGLRPETTGRVSRRLGRQAIITNPARRNFCSWYPSWQCGSRSAARR